MKAIFSNLRLFYCMIVCFYPTIANAHTPEWTALTLLDSAEIFSITHIQSQSGSHIALAQNSIGQIVVLQDQVQIAILDSLGLNAFRQHYPNYNFKKDSTQSPSLESQSKTVQEQLQDSLPWRKWGEWPTNLDFRTSIDLQTSKLTTERDSWGVEWNTKINDLFWAWIGFNGYSDHGALAATLQSRDSTLFSNWGWTLGIGLPWIRYQIQSADWKNVPFMFLEPDVQGDLNYKKYYLLKIAGSDTLSSSYSSNYLHLFEGKLGYFHIKYWIDDQIYSQNIWQFLLQDLPLGQSTWWMGITSAGNSWAPGIGANFFNINLGHYGIFNQDYNPRLSLYVDTWWRGPLNNELCLGLQLRLPNFYSEIK